MSTIVLTIGLLILSNAFMTIAWYGHLRHKDVSLIIVVLVSWLIALPEYALQVPANRWGSAVLSATQLKVIQEAISLGVFVIFAWLYLGEAPTGRTAAAFGLIVLAVLLIRGDRPTPIDNPEQSGYRSAS